MGSLFTKWCFDNKENFDLKNFNLEENVDFTLNIELDKNCGEAVSIEYNCGKLISLPKNGTKVQMSNYYKHSQSKGCGYIKSNPPCNKRPRVFSYVIIQT